MADTNTPSVSSTTNIPSKVVEKKKINYENEASWTVPYDEKQLEIIRDRMITGKTYENLKDKDKERYIKKPNEVSFAEIVQLLSDMGVLAVMLGPIFDLLKTVPQPNPIDKIVTAFKTIDKLMDLMTKIETLEDVPIIGPLAAPVLRSLRVFFEVCLALINFIIMIFDGTIFVWFKLKKQIPIIQQKIKEMKESNKDPDTLKKKIEQLEKEVEDGDYVFTSTKEYKQLVAELNKIAKPIFDIFDMTGKIIENFTLFVEMFDDIDWESENFVLEKFVKFVCGKSWSEMKKDAQVRAEKMFKGGPMTILAKITDAVDGFRESKYILKEDYIKLLEHKKAVKKQIAEEKARKEEEEKSKKTSEYGILAKAWTAIVDDSIQRGKKRAEENSSKPSISK